MAAKNIDMRYKDIALTSRDVNNSQEYYYIATKLGLYILIKLETQIDVFKEFEKVRKSGQKQNTRSRWIQLQFIVVVCWSQYRPIVNKIWQLLNSTKQFGEFRWWKRCNTYLLPMATTSMTS